MMLYEEGAFELSDPIAKWLPEFAETRVYVAGSAMKPVTAPQVEPIRVRHLLTHTSGLTYGFHHAHPVDTMYRAAGHEWSTPPGADSAEVCRQWAAIPLVFQPGGEWNYGVSTDVLGRLVEVLSGQPLDEFFEQRIFAPLGMRAIKFWPSDAEWQRVATIYRLENGALGRFVSPNDAMSRGVYFRGSGGLFSTAESYVPFGIMLANGGELNGVRLLSRKSVEMLRAVHVPDTLPGRPAGEGYGLGVRVVTDHAARGTLLSNGTYGWSGAQGTHFFVDPEEELVGVLMVQTPNNEVRSDFENLVAQAVSD
jgi:CubicO group peptidase (beta-lactamase class C family)